MAKELRDVRVLCEEKKSFFALRSLTNSAITVIDIDKDKAFDRIDHLISRLLQHDPNIVTYDRNSDPIVRHLKFSIPIIRFGVMDALDLQLFAVCTRVVSKDTDRARWSVFLPQIERGIEVDDLKNLELTLAEYFRSWFSLDARVPYLLDFTESLLTADGEPRFQVSNRLIRFKTNEDSGEESEIQPETLSQVGDPLHLRMLRRDAPRAYRRNRKVSQLLGHLSETAERSVLLIGEPGCGKTSIFYEAVHRIAHKRAPENLKKIPVWQVSGGRLLAGTRYLGEWQERLLKVIGELKESGGILYTDNLIELLDTAGNEQHSQGIPGMLLPHILSGDIVFVTEARPDQLAHAEQTNPSFLRALRPMPIDPMDLSETDAVLEKAAIRLKRQYKNANLPSSTRARILELVGRFKGNTVLPGPGVELLERVFRTYGDTESKEFDLRGEQVLASYSSFTGLPIELLDASISFRAEDVREYFDDAVFAQPKAVTAVVDLITCIRAGLNDPSRPLASFLFLGPTGVGKTQTALTLAEYLFGSRDRLVRFDMSEYQDQWTAGRLVGRFKGEVGELVRKLRDQPFQVVLLDEIEKAHPLVFDYLLQVFGEGRLTDGTGRTVDATNSVFIMTSNLGSGGPSGLGFGSTDSDKTAKEVAHYKSAVEQYFRPEFVGRIDRVIPFLSLGGETAKKLVERALERALTRDGLERRNIMVEANEEVVQFLIRTGFNEKYGARPLQRAVENFVTVPLARFLNENHSLRDVTLSVILVDGLPAIS